MLLSFLIILPLFGILIIFIFNTEKIDLFSVRDSKNFEISEINSKNHEINEENQKNKQVNDKTLKIIALVVTVVDLFLSLII